MSTDIRNLSIQFKSVKPATQGAAAAGKGKDAEPAKGKGKKKGECTSVADGNGEPGGWQVDARRQLTDLAAILRER